MKTPCGEIDDSWESVVGDKGSMAMLEVIRQTCQLADDNEVLGDMLRIPVAQLKAIVIVDRRWGPHVCPLKYESYMPPDGAVNVGKLLGRLPDTSSWVSKGILAIAFPMVSPAGHEARFRPVWEGWIRQLLKGLSARKQTASYAFVLMGRNSHRLKNSIAMSMPLVMTVDPSGWDYVREGVCAFKAINTKGRLEISW